MAEREPSLVTPFWVRIATETSLSPGWLLIAFPAVLYPAYLLLEVLFGRGLAAAMDFGGDFDARMVPVWATALGYISMMAVYVARGTFHDLEGLRPVLRGGEAAYTKLREQLSRFGRWRLWVGALLWVAFYCVAAELSIGRWTGLLAGECSFRTICIVAAAFAAWILAGRGLVYVIDSSRLYSQIGERHVEVDLLDLDPLSHLTRHGLRIVLFMVIWLVPLMTASIVGHPSRSPSYMATALIGPLITLVVATTAFLLPVRGLRRQIRARKAEELAKVREDIRTDQDLVAQRGPDSAEAGARPPGLLAYKHEIESVREWPFDAPTLTRFFLYVAIPLGSWVGGALVERLLGAALD